MAEVFPALHAPHRVSKVNDLPWFLFWELGSVSTVGPILVRMTKPPPAQSSSSWQTDGAWSKRDAIHCYERPFLSGAVP